MRGRDVIPGEKSPNSADPSLGEVPIVWKRIPPSTPTKKYDSKCAQFENAYKAQQAREGIPKNVFNSNSNNKLIRISVWFQFVNSVNSSKIISLC